MPNLSDLEKQAYKALLSRMKKYEGEVAEVYRQALIKMIGEMKVMFDKWSKEGKLTKVEMTQYNRMATMEKQMLKYLDPAVKETLGTIQNLLPEQYGEAFFRYAWAMDQAVGVSLQYGLLNKDTIIENLANKYQKIAYKNYIKGTKGILRNTLNDGLSRGKSFDDMARSLKKATNMKNYQALRIIRTEGMTAENAGQTDSYLKAKEQGVNGHRVWMSTLDQRTRPSPFRKGKKGKMVAVQLTGMEPDHRIMDGQVEDEDGMFTLSDGTKARFPADPEIEDGGQRCNERCTVRMEIDGYSPQLRRTRENGIIPYQNFDSWAKKVNNGEGFWE